MCRLEFGFSCAAADGRPTQAGFSNIGPWARLFCHAAERARRGPRSAAPRYSGSGVRACVTCFGSIVGHSSNRSSPYKELRKSVRMCFYIEAVRIGCRGHGCPEDAAGLTCFLCPSSLLYCQPQQLSSSASVPAQALIAAYSRTSVRSLFDGRAGGWRSLRHRNRSG